MIAVLLASESFPFSLAALGIFLEIAVLACGAVWVVGKISAHTDTLSSSISHLAETIAALQKAVSHLDGKVNEHSVRIAVLERD